MPVGAISIGSLSDAVAAAVSSVQAQQGLQAAVSRLASGETTGSAPAVGDGIGGLLNVMA